MDSLPSGWMFVENYEETTDEFVQGIDQEVDEIYFHPEYEVGLFLLSNSAQTIVACRSEIHRWVVETNLGANDEAARQFVEHFESIISDRDGIIDSPAIHSATYESLKNSPYRPAPTNETPSSNTYQTEAERFFDGYIPGGTLGGRPHYGSALSCPPPWHSDGHSEAWEGVKDTKFHMVWDGDYGFVVGWYCSDCNPQSLQDVERGWIPFSKEWDEAMQQTEAEMGMIGANIWMATRPDTQLESDDPIKDAISIDILEDYFKTPERWEMWAGVPLWPGDTDLLINCDLVEVETPSRFSGDGELVIRRPKVIDQEERTYPWN